VSRRRPFPPADLRKRPLPLTRSSPGTLWARIHRVGRSPLWFGPAPGNPAENRFDDPHGDYRVCYIGTTKEAAFAEVFLRDLSVEVLSQSDLKMRSLTPIEVIREVRVVTLHGRALGRLGATAEVASGGDCQVSQAWGRSLWEHPDQPDGILYRARHNDDEHSVALYHRAATSVKPLVTIDLSARPDLVAELLEHYDIGLT